MYSSPSLTEGSVEVNDDVIHLKDGIQIVDTLDLSLLTKIGINCCHLPEFPSIRSDVLEHLLLLRNSMTEFNTAGFDLPNLKTLDISGNKITSLIIEHGDFPSLKTLTADCNKLNELVVRSDSIEAIFADDNAILSVDIEGVNLQMLNLCDNKLTTLEGVFPSLNSLSVNYNRLTDIDIEAPELVYLFADANRLKDFTNRYSLERLVLRRNLITMPAFAINDITYLKLSHNPIVDYKGNKWNIRCVESYERYLTTCNKQMEKNKLNKIKSARK